jgi:hypothetical protein
MGWICLSRRLMPKGFFRAVLCSFVFVGQMHAQEVIVPREKKPEAPKPTAQPLEQIPSETPAPTPAPTRRKSRSHEKKSAPAALTLEEMRTAGERAAGGSNEGSVSEPTKSRKPRVETAPSPIPTVAQTPRPVRKETPVERRSTPRPAGERTTKSEAIDIGPIRPTMIESGREPPSPSPSGR